METFVGPDRPLDPERYFGIQRLHAVLGWSMGAQQTYEWAVRFPDMVPHAAVFAGTALAEVRLGLKRHAVAFSLMGLSAAFWREEGWRPLDFASADDFRQGFIRGTSPRWTQQPRHPGPQVAVGGHGDACRRRPGLFDPPEDCEADCPGRLTLVVTYDRVSPHGGQPRQVWGVEGCRT